MNLTEIRRELHRFPETGFQEFKTQEYLIRKLKNYRCVLFKIKTGVIAYFNNRRPTSLAYRSDMDGLNIQETGNSPYKSENQCMHACGHDAHMALALGICEYLNDHYTEYESNFVILFQPSEETFGGSRLILDSGILKRLKVRTIIGLHLFPKLEKGAFFSGKVVFASAREIDFTISGKSVHVANRDKESDCLKAGMELVKKITSFSDKNTLVHIGTFSSGKTRNTVSPISEIRGTIRSKTKDEKILRKIKDEVLALKEKYRLKISDDTSRYLPPIKNDSLTLERAKKLVSLRLLDTPFFQGEDFSLYTEEYPCLFLLLGIGDVPYLHSPDFDFDDGILEHALKQLIPLLKIDQ